MTMPIALTKALAMLMVAQALLGLIFQDSYRDVEWIKATWYGNDWVTLTAAVPLLSIGLVAATRGSKRGLLLWFGMVAYAVYNSAFYLFGAALNAFFPIYVASVVLATIALILGLTRVNPADVAGGFRSSTPSRIIGGALVFIGIGFASAWSGLWAAYVFGGRPTPVDPEAQQIAA